MGNVKPATQEQLLSMNYTLQARLRELEEGEAAICPEDVGFVEYIKSLEAQLELNRWIPVAEGLPERIDHETEYSKDVWVLDMKSQWVGVDQYLTGLKRWNGEHTRLTLYTHWKYITLPKE